MSWLDRRWQRFDRHGNWWFGYSFSPRSFALGFGMEDWRRGFYVHLGWLSVGAFHA